jgi:hypothetical protein
LCTGRRPPLHANRIATSHALACDSDPRIPESRLRRRRSNSPYEAQIGKRHFEGAGNNGPVTLLCQVPEEQITNCNTGAGSAERRGSTGILPVYMEGPAEGLTGKVPVPPLSTVLSIQRSRNAADRKLGGPRYPLSKIQLASQEALKLSSEYVLLVTSSRCMMKLRS